MKKDNATKSTLEVLRAHSLREMVEKVNNYNQEASKSTTLSPILKEDIVNLTREEDTYFLIYFK